MNELTLGTEYLDENNMELYKKIVSDNLNEFNLRTGDNVRLQYKPNKFAYFVRVDKDIPPYFGNYFDDYCLWIINWLISLHGSQKIVEDWINDRTLSRRILEAFTNRNGQTPKEKLLFTKIFSDYTPIAPYLNDTQKDELKKQINNVVKVVSQS